MASYVVKGCVKDDIPKIFDKVYEELSDENSVYKSMSEIQDLINERLGISRSDDDVYKLKLRRDEQMRLEKSHKNVMKILNKTVDEDHHIHISEDDGPTSCRHCILNALHLEDEDGMGNRLKSFVTIGVVQEGSPAHLGGLRKNDKVLRFGSINNRNFTDINQLQDIVMGSIDLPLIVQVSRNEETHDLTIIPRRWERPGLFGCQMIKETCVIRTIT